MCVKIGDCDVFLEISVCDECWKLGECEIYLLEVYFGECDMCLFMGECGKCLLVIEVDK